MAHASIPEIHFGKPVGDAERSVITIKSSDPNALELKIFFHSYFGFNATSTLICGKRDAILVTATFLLSDCYRMIAGILETGKNLTHVVVPEFHPDHWFTSVALQEAFPKVKIVAMQSVVRDIVYAANDKLELWSKLFGNNIPERFSFPMPLTDGRLEIEGQAVELSDGWDADMMNETVVWIPSLRAAIPSDLVFYNAHPWTLESDPPRRQKWKADIKKLRAMEPLIVIPGHTVMNGFKFDGTTAIDWTLSYLDEFDAALAKAKSGDELVEIMERKFPNVYAIGFGLHWQARAAFPDKCSERIRPLPGTFHTIATSETGEPVYQ